MTTGVFAEWENKIWKHRFQAEAVVEQIHGSTPDNPKVVEGWIRSKIQDNDDMIQEAVAEVMVELGISADEAAQKVIDKTVVNRFKRDDNGLYIEGRIIKAAIKEAASVGIGSGIFKAGKAVGVTSKGYPAFIAEHVQVDERRVYLGVNEADRVAQKFIHTWRGNAVGYEEEIDEAKIAFTISSDWDFGEEFWAKLWVIGQKQGLGGSRSQSFGTYTITRWDPLD